MCYVCQLVYFLLIILAICYSMAFAFIPSVPIVENPQFDSEVIGSVSTELMGMTISSHTHVVDIMTQPGLFVLSLLEFWILSGKTEKERDNSFQWQYPDTTVVKCGR